MTADSRQRLMQQPCEGSGSRMVKVANIEHQVHRFRGMMQNSVPHLGLTLGDLRP